MPIIDSDVRSLFGTLPFNLPVTWDDLLDPETLNEWFKDRDDVQETAAALILGRNESTDLVQADRGINARCESYTICL